MVIPIHGLKTVAEHIREYPQLADMSMKLTTWREFSPEVFAMLHEERARLIVEIGSWRGYSTAILAEHCETVLAVDTWLGAREFYTHPDESRELFKLAGYPQIYYQFLTNMHHRGVADRVVPFPLPSSIALDILHDSGVRPDVVYVDGSHDFADVTRDLAGAWRLHPRIIFGDDYGDHYPGVKTAVDLLVTTRSVQSFYTAGEYYFIRL